MESMSCFFVRNLPKRPKKGVMPFLICHEFLNSLFLEIHVFFIIAVLSLLWLSGSGVTPAFFIKSECPVLLLAVRS